MELKCLESLYREKEIFNKNNEVVAIKHIPVRKNFVTKIDIELEDIVSIKEIYNNKGKIYKSRCLGHHRFLGDIVFNYSYKKLKEIKESNVVKVKGFRK